MDGDSIGLGTIVIGLVLVIGAVRGTWKQVFSDLLKTGGAAGVAAPDVPGSGPGGTLAVPGQGQCVGGGRSYAAASAADCGPGDTFVPAAPAAVPQALMATGPATGGLQFQ
jgi:hypothetical protein